jgi:DGQHR domain-containing protein
MATQTLSRGQKAAATRKANAEKAAAQIEAASKTDSVTEKVAVKEPAPAVDPMFSDNAEEKIDTEGRPAPEADIVLIENAVEEAAPVKKERRMAVQAEFVPGKAALATMTADALHDLAFVSTYNTIDEQSSSPRQHGYQRDPMAARFPAIGRYFAQQEGDGVHTHAHLITPIIASVRVYNDKEREEFTKLFNAGDIDGIHQRFGTSVVSIVDGQHRSGGLFWAWEREPDFNPDVPIMLYFGLRYGDEATLFDDINTNQRKLPKALIEATKVHMEAGEATHAQTIREVARALAEDGDSVWYGKVNMTGGPENRHLPVTYEGLRRATGNMLQEKLIARLERQGLSLEKVAKKYWELVSRACAPAWQERPRVVKNDEGEQTEEAVKYRLKDLAGVASVSRLGADILGTALDQSRTDEEFWSAVASMVSKLGVIDWEKRPGNPWTSAGAGFAGMTGLYAMLYDLVYLDKAPGVSAEE